MPRRSRFAGLWACLAVLGVMAGCGRSQPSVEPPEAPVVPVAHPVEEEVTDYVDYTGRIAAVNAVDIRPRVSGYITSAPFTEGVEIEKGTLLFQIDPAPYQAALDAAKAQLTLNQANARLASANYARALREGAGAISRQELETYQATEAQAVASVNLYKANVKTADLNLGWTRVTSPITGQVSRYYYTVGNLVQADQTLLTTVVSVDPMYAYWDMDERTVLRVRKAINAGAIKAAKSITDVHVFMGLEGETGYPHEGHLNFINNTVNPSTGTISVRAQFDNPKPKNGRRLLIPGMFIRIHLPIGQKHPATLVIDRAIGTDQGLKFVYVVGPDHKVRYQRVTIGAMQNNGLRVVQGVSKDDWVVVGALPQVRPNMEVSPEENDMRQLAAASLGQAPAPVPGKPQPPPRGK